MARPKKSDEKVKDSANLQISVEDFIRTRDSVVTGLSSLQSAVSDLSRAYIAHTNTVLGKGSGTSLDQLSFQNPLTVDNGLFGVRAPTPAPTTETGDGKKRKRAPHDKNAPKRALTPFFLYLQTARPIIAKQMGDKHTAKEVQDEGGKRWREMPSEERDKWTEKYGINFARYKEHTKAYKAGLPIPEISDAEAKKLYEKTKKTGKIPEAAHLDSQDASDTSDDSSSEDESREPYKAPSPVPVAKRQKVTKETAKKKIPVVKPVPTEQVDRVVSPVAEWSSKTPEKKKKGSKKRDTKNADEIAESKKDITAAEPASSPKLANHDSQQKPKRKGKKRKSGEVEP